jgi:hypothetical protein
MNSKLVKTVRRNDRRNEWRGRKSSLDAVDVLGEGAKNQRLGIRSSICIIGRLRMNIRFDFSRGDRDVAQ